MHWIAREGRHQNLFSVWDLKFDPELECAIFQLTPLQNWINVVMFGAGKAGHVGGSSKQNKHKHNLRGVLSLLHASPSQLVPPRLELTFLFLHSCGNVFAQQQKRSVPHPVKK